MIVRKTIFSPCRRYRYTLWREFWREWDTQGNPLFPSTGPVNGHWPQFVQFIGLNPSTADEVKDDPTIRRCIGFAKSWGFGALCMTNAFAWRDTDPKKMKVQAEPIGPENDHWLTQVSGNAGLVIAAWGNHGTHMGRSAQIQAMIPNLHCLKISKKTGQPYHPLYLPKTLQPIRL